MPQELALLKARGERIVELSKEYDNDAVGLYALKMRATGAFPAGVFALYYAYPYYPDFMVVDPGYAKARSPDGPSNYLGICASSSRTTATCLSSSASTESRHREALDTSSRRDGITEVTPSNNRHS